MVAFAPAHASSDLPSSLAPRQVAKDFSYSRMLQDSVEHQRGKDLPHVVSRFHASDVVEWVGEHDRTKDAKDAACDPRRLGSAYSVL